jgi:hypothetical protein
MAKRKTAAKESDAGSGALERLRQVLRGNGRVTGFVVVEGGGPFGEPVPLRRITGGWGVFHESAAEADVIVEAVALSAELVSPAPTDEDPDAVTRETVTGTVRLPEPLTISAGNAPSVALIDAPDFGSAAEEPPPAAEIAASRAEREAIDPIPAAPSPAGGSGEAAGRTKGPA